ncbi:MAG: histidine phosphatase family protein, partial [Pirellulales bacterium]
EQGSDEVARLAEDLRGQGIQMVYAPASEPAWQTGLSLAEALAVKFKRLDRLQNLDHGLWQGMLVDDVRQKQPKVYKQWQEQPENVRPPEGEMLGDAEERIRAALSKLLKRHKTGTVGLVVSEPLASLVRRLVVHNALGNLWKATGSHGNWEVLDLQPENLMAVH